MLIICRRGRQGRGVHGPVNRLKAGLAGSDGQRALHQAPLLQHVYVHGLEVVRDAAVGKVVCGNRRNCAAQVRIRHDALQVRPIVASGRIV
jgi:hypothetical protein